MTALRNCPYCGRPCSGASCHLHRDLAAIERSALVRDVDAEIARLQRLAVPREPALPRPTKAWRQ